MANIIIRNGNNKAERDCSQVEARIAYILMKSGVAGPEIDACLLWAFGPDSLYVPIFPDWVDRWHKLHPKQFRVKRKDNFVEFLYVIGFLYCVEKRKAQLKIK